MKSISPLETFLAASNIYLSLNPHFIIFVGADDDTLALAKEYGPLIETSTEFPEKTNVEFVEVLAKDEVKAVKWATRKEIEQLVKEYNFIPI